MSIILRRVYGLWLSVDPLAEKYPGWSPYNYTLQNPVKLVDPDGRSVAKWEPKLNKDGSTSYMKEEGDDASTLASQYGLDQDVADELYASMEDGEISGQSVYNVNPYSDENRSEFLKLDLNSERATEQRIFDQYLYGRDRTSSKGDWAFSSKRYYSNTKYKNVLRGSAEKCINGQMIELKYAIPVYNPGTLSGPTHFGLGISPIGAPQQPGGMFGPKQRNVEIPLYHPSKGGRAGKYWIHAKGSDADVLVDRLRKEFPRHNYNYFGNGFKN